MVKLLKNNKIRAEKWRGKKQSHASELNQTQEDDERHGRTSTWEEHTGGMRDMGESPCW